MLLCAEIASFLLEHLQPLEYHGCPVPQLRVGRFRVVSEKSAGDRIDYNLLLGLWSVPHAFSKCFSFCCLEGRESSIPIRG